MQREAALACVVAIGAVGALLPSAHARRVALWTAGAAALVAAIVVVGRYDAGLREASER